MIIKSETNYFKDNEIADFIIASKKLNLSKKKISFITELYTFYILESNKTKNNEIEISFNELEKSLKMNRINIYKNFLVLEEKNIITIKRNENNKFKEITLLNVSRWNT